MTTEHKNFCPSLINPSTHLSLCQWYCWGDGALFTDCGSLQGYYFIFHFMSLIITIAVAFLWTRLRTVYHIGQYFLYQHWIKWRLIPLRINTILWLCAFSHFQVLFWLSGMTKLKLCTLILNYSQPITADFSLWYIIQYILHKTADSARLEGTGEENLILS